MKKLILLFLVLSVCLSCKTLLTTDIRARIIAEEIPIEKVQFYNTKKIVLFREVNSNKGETLKHGKVRFINGKYYEFLKFRKNTPCICVTDSVKNLAVSFEENSTLKFGNEGNYIYLSNDNMSNKNSYSSGSNYYILKPQSGNYRTIPYYQIYADCWKLGKSYSTSYSDIEGLQVGKVNYADSTYLIIQGKNARLSLKKKQLDNLNYKHRVVKGLKVE